MVRPSVVSRIVAVGTFGLVPIMDPFPATVVATLGIGLLIGSLIDPPSTARDSRVLRIVTVGAVLITLVVGSGRGEFALPEPAGWWPVVWIGAVVLATVLLLVGRFPVDRIVTGIAVLILVSLSIGVLAEFGSSGVGFDSYLSHEVAADVLAAGDNPYTDAVSIPSGSPTAEPGETIDGYSYPPAILIPIVAADWVFGDPRWAAVVAIAVALAVFAFVTDRSRTGAGAAALLLLSATPTFRSVVWAGWTEPVTVALAVLAVVTWRRWLVSAILLGLALATKQYMVLLVPFLLMVEARPWKRTMTAVGVATATLIPLVLLDVGAFWSTLIARPLSLEFRPDARSLSGGLAQLGLDLSIPPLVVLVVILGVSWGLSNRVELEQVDAVVAGFAVLLATGFLLSFAFANYWWLVQWLAAASVIMKPGASIQRQRSTGFESSFDDQP